jgi:hypothetical protein
MPDLAQVLKIASRIEADMVQLRAALVELAAREDPPPDPHCANSTMPPAKRAKWTGPVPAEIVEQRRQRHIWRARLAIELHRNPSVKVFADAHALAPSEVYRHTTARKRSIAPQSIPDISINRCLSQEISELEAELARRHGSKIIATLRELMFPHNSGHGRGNTRVATDRGRVPVKVPRESHGVDGPRLDAVGAGRVHDGGSSIAANSAKVL